MSLQFIIGRAGAGKSYLLHKKMIAASREKTNKNFIAVVPEQFSMETQKEILELHEKSGSFNIEVTSFTRLAYSVFEEQGFSGYKVMDDLGKTLVMRKVLEDCKKELVIYKDKTAMPGFAEKMKMVISELKQYGIGQSQLSRMTEVAGSRPSLKHKLRDIEVINKAFNDYIKEKMITTEDVLTIFCKHIPNSEFIRNTYFYFDGYTGFTPSQYAVLELLIKHAPEVTVAITLPEDEKGFQEYSKYELFGLSKETIVKLTELADKNNIEIKKTVVAGENKSPYRIRNNKALCYVEQNIFRNRAVPKYEESCDAIEIHGIAKPHGEAAFVASAISRLVTEEGYRYNDIAVITGDMEGYYRYLEEELNKYRIPAFIDHKRNISSNPFVDGIKAAIEIIEKDFSYESVFHMLRLGFIDVDICIVDLMENYVLQSGRRGYKSYSHQWEKLYKGMEKENLEQINFGREKVFETIKPLRNAMKNKNSTILDFTKAVYTFILSQNMQKKIDNYAKMFRENKMLSQAKEYEQTYFTIVSMLERIVSLMGDEVVSIKEYKQILQAGFESVKVGIIPPGLDTVMVGDIERTRLKDTKRIIFFIGVNDGIIPGGGVSGGILTDTDREYLQDNHYILAPTARENVFQQRLYLYSLLAKPTEKMILTYSKSASDGSVRRKSYLIGNLQKLFGNMHIIDEDHVDFDMKNITNKQAALNYLADNIREYRLKGEDRLFEQISSVLLKDKECRKKIELMSKGTFYSSNTPSLRKDIAAKLYGVKDNIGITRLERFASCAYSQFLNNGLKLGERKKFEIAAFDIGNLYHDTINRFFQEVQKEDLDWNSLEEGKSHLILENCVERVMEEYDNDALEGTARNLFIKNKVRETASRTVDILVEHIRTGEFVPAEYELRVAHGRIDRVDILKKEKDLYVKVIDYKSGNKKFSISDTFLGLQMQLMVYLKDAMDYEQKKHPQANVLPAGGLYFHVHDPYIEKPDFEKIIRDYRDHNPESDLRDEDIKYAAVRAAQYKAFRMSGIVNSDAEIIECMDSRAFEKTGASDILPVQTTKSGLGARSVVLDSETYKKFIDYVSDMAEQMKEEILEGNIDINPVEGTCDYCPYGGICGFDRKLGDRFRKKPQIGLEDVTERVSPPTEDVMGQEKENGISKNPELSGEKNDALDR